MEFNIAGEFAAVSTLLTGKSHVDTQNISPLSFITEINLSFMSITRSDISQNGLLDTIFL